MFRISHAAILSPWEVPTSQSQPHTACEFSSSFLLNFFPLCLPLHLQSHYFGQHSLDYQQWSLPSLDFPSFLQWINGFGAQMLVLLVYTFSGASHVQLFPWRQVIQVILFPSLTLAIPRTCDQVEKHLQNCVGGVCFSWSIFGHFIRFQCDLETEARILSLFANLEQGRLDVVLSVLLESVT